MRTIARRGWLGWAVGLAVVALALGGWGFLPRSSVVADEGGGEHQPRQEAPQIDILLVPEYLYADATAAVPVKFKFIDMGSTVEMEKVEVKFIVDGVQKIFKDYTTRFAKDDGFGVVGNGDSDTYTVWVPISDFQFQVEDDLTDNCFFLVHAKARPVGETEWEWFTSVYTDEDARPKVFGDASIQVVEIGKDDQWSVLSGDFLQTNADSSGVQAWDHIADLHGFCSGSFPHDASPQGCDMAQICFPDDWHNTVSATDKVRTLSVALYNDGFGGGWMTPDNTVLNRIWDVRIGAWFGVSYGHKAVVVISNPGMDLATDEGDFGLDLFSDGKVKYCIEAVDDTQGNNLGIAAGAMTIGWGLASGGWGAVLGTLAGVTTILASQSTADDDTAEVVCQGFRFARPPQGHWNRHQEFIFRKKEDGSDQNGEAHPMDQDKISCVVGEARMFTIILSASCVASNWDWYGDSHAEAEIEYCVDAIGFDAENAIQVQAW